MEIVKRELEVGKDSIEIAEGLKELILDIRAGKDIAAITAENLPSLITMVDGYENLSAEMKHTSRNATIAYSGYCIGEALAPVSE